MLDKWLREPLLHFLLLGAALFLLYGLRNADVSVAGDEINITRAHIERAVSMFEKRWQRPPTKSEYDELIEQQIREEVLYREALGMGLDKHDAVVRRRMVQKVEFITADIADLVVPTEKQLSDYLAANIEKFELPSRISFRQIFFNAERRDEDVEEDIRQVLAMLRQPDSGIDIRTIGDPLMFGLDHARMTKREVARMLGDGFAKELFGLPVGQWQEPIASGYGLHLVYVQEKTASTRPELAAVRDDVQTEWLASQRRATDESFYRSLRQRYTIVVEDPIGEQPL